MKEVLNICKISLKTVTEKLLSELNYFFAQKVIPNKQVVKVITQFETKLIMTDKMITIPANQKLSKSRNYWVHIFKQYIVVQRPEELKKQEPCKINYQRNMIALNIL